MERSFYKKYFQLEKDNWWFRVRRNLIVDLLAKYNISKTAPIFDLGCGSGYTIGYLQKLGYNVSGTDISAEAIEFGRSQGVDNIEVAQTGHIRPPEKGFDVILALDVIEHIQDDVGAIKAIELALKPGGIAIITVPAYQWLWGVQDDVAHHYRRYTLNSFSHVFHRNTKLAVAKKTYFDTFLFPPIAIVRLISKWFNINDRESDFDINNPLLNKVFFWIFDLERSLLRCFRFPFGVSILLVLRKND